MKYLLFTAALLISTSIVAQREKRSTPDFTSINVSVPGTLHLRQGNGTSVELAGETELIYSIETVVKKEELNLELKKEFRKKWKNRKVEMYITVTNLKAVTVNGQCEVSAEGYINTGDLKLMVHGDGSISIQNTASGEVETGVFGSGQLRYSGRCKNFECSIRGSGKATLNTETEDESSLSVSGSGIISIEGRGSKADLSINGSGQINGDSFEVKKCKIKISGSGNTTVGVSNDLDAKISGSGIIRYKGNPKVNSQVNGSGKISKL